MLENEHRSGKKRIPLEAFARDNQGTDRQIKSIENEESMRRAYY